MLSWIKKARSLVLINMLFWRQDGAGKTVLLYKLQVNIKYHIAIP